MAFGDQDLPAMFSDFGVPVLYAGFPPAMGILDTYNDIFTHGAGPGGFESNQVIVRIPYNAFPRIPAPLEAITVDGLNYTVKSHSPDHDSGTVELFLKGPLAS